MPVERGGCTDPGRGAGQYWIVVGGSLHDQRLDKMSCLFLIEDEPALKVVAGPGGVEILAMQFPKTVSRRR